jgi:hypothetical protein
MRQRATKKILFAYTVMENFDHRAAVRLYQPLHKNEKWISFAFPNPGSFILTISGNDANTGSGLNSPWKTIGKLNTTKLFA